MSTPSVCSHAPYLTPRSPESSPFWRHDLKTRTGMSNVEHTLDAEVKEQIEGFQQSSATHLFTPWRRVVTLISVHWMTGEHLTRWQGRNHTPPDLEDCHLATAGNLSPHPIHPPPVLKAFRPQQTSQSFQPKHQGPQKTNTRSLHLDALLRNAVTCQIVLSQFNHSSVQRPHPNGWALRHKYVTRIHNPPIDHLWLNQIMQRKQIACARRRRK